MSNIEPLSSCESEANQNWKKKKFFQKYLSEYVVKYSLFLSLLSAIPFCLYSEPVWLQYVYGRIGDLEKHIDTAKLAAKTGSTNQSVNQFNISSLMTSTWVVPRAAATKPPPPVIFCQVEVSHIYMTESTPPVIFIPTWVKSYLQWRRRL